MTKYKQCVAVVDDVDDVETVTFVAEDGKPLTESGWVEYITDRVTDLVSYECK